MVAGERTHFTETGVKFLGEIALNNDREWFSERKAVYEAEVKAPMLATIGAVNDAMLEFAPDYVREPAKCMFRIYRDTRFSKDKRPYKDHVGAWWGRRGLEKTSGGGFYFHVSGSEVVVAAGVYMPEKDQLLGIRRHLVERHEEYLRLIDCEELRAAGMTPGEPERMARIPKGFAADGAAGEVLRQRQWGVSAKLPVEMALAETLAAEVARRFSLAAPLVAWLNAPFAERCASWGF